MIESFALSAPYRNGRIFAPSSGKPASYGSFRYSERSCPVGYVHSNSVCSDVMDTSAVAVLSFPISPNTVARFISETSVYSLNRKSAWAFAHVSNEIRKTGAPSFANAYPSTSVVGIASRACGIAPRYNALPYLVCLCSGLPMRNTYRFDVLSMDAPAGMCFPPKVTSGYDLSVPAVANAVPEYLTVNVFSGAGFNKKPMEFLTSKVLAFAHFVTSKLLTVNGAWQSAVRQIFGSYPSQAGRILA